VSTVDVDAAVQEYLAQPANFGDETPAQRAAESDAFRAGAAWAVQAVDWRVLGGLVPGPLEARHLRAGDRIVCGPMDLVVREVSRTRTGIVHLSTVTDGGAPVVVERAPIERVRVRAAGQEVPR
jgi:hypothetical protein